MRLPLAGRKRVSLALVIMAALLLCFSPVALAASGEGDAGVRGWEATDTYRVMNFTVLAVVLFLLLRKPVPKALNARIDGIREQLRELEDKKAAAESELTQYAEKLAKLDEEAETIVAEYIRQGEEAKVRIIKEAEATAEKLEDQAKRLIDNEFARAKASLQAEVIDKALAQAEEILKAKIDDDDQNRLVDEYLEKVVA